MGQLEDMDTFVRIVDTGSISQAANQLGMVKSAISRRLNDLEVRLGTQLLNRTTRKSSLTEAGQNYYERSLQILSDVREVNEATSKSRATITGTLKISAPLSFGLLHMPSIINEFSDLHPDLVIHIDFNDRQIDLIDEGYDIAIRIADLKDSSLMALKLAPIRNILCASPDYIARMGEPQDPQDLKGHHILRYTNAPSNIWHFTGQDGQKHAVTLPIKIYSNNGDFLQSLAVQGQGIIHSPTFIVWREIASGELVKILDHYQSPPLNAYAVYPPTRHLAARLRLFIDFLKVKFNGEPYWDKGIIPRIT